jgi:[acyl-carrier-protein] S-malonyltransferase
MGMIIGLDENDLQLMLKNESGVMLCNQNNLYTFVISGLRDAVEKIISQAKTEGAMRTSVLPVSRPYHSHFLKKAVPVFSSAIQKVHFNEAAFTYISSINQEAIRNPEDLRKEVISNLSACMNWYKTMRSLLTPGTNRFFECGAGDGLTRNTRFIHGDFKAYAISRLESFIRECSK